MPIPKAGPHPNHQHSVDILGRCHPLVMACYHGAGAKVLEHCQYLMLPFSSSSHPQHKHNRESITWYSLRPTRKEDHLQFPHKRPLNQTHIRPSCHQLTPNSARLRSWAAGLSVGTGLVASTCLNADAPYLYNSGKSSLTVQFVENHFVESYYPTIENTFSRTIKFKGQEYATEIIDTAGQVCRYFYSAIALSMPSILRA